MELGDRGAAVEDVFPTRRRSLTGSAGQQPQ